MRLDSHQHFWRYSQSEYPWIKQEWIIRRDFLPADLEPLLKHAALDGCIAVQARQSLEETRWLLELAAEFTFIKGVVGWVDLRSNQVEEQLAEFSLHPKLAGVRHVVQDEPNDDFMLGADFRRGIAQLAGHDLTFDLLIFPKQLPAAISLVSHFPEQRFVLDHIAKPDIKEVRLSPWRERIRELAKLPNVMCKLSGMVTEARWVNWKPEDFQPFLDVVFDAFGVDRLMFGSDWPVCLLAGDYNKVFGLVSERISSLPQSTQEKILGANAERFYLRRRCPHQ